MLNRGQTITNADPARAISAEMALLRKQGLQNFSLALSEQRCVIKRRMGGVLRMALLEQIEQSTRLFRSRGCAQNGVENIPGIASTRFHSRHRCSVLSKNADVTARYRRNHNR